MKIELCWNDVERMEDKMKCLYGEPSISKNDVGYVISFANSPQFEWVELRPWGGVDFEDESKMQLKGTIVLIKIQ